MKTKTKTKTNSAKKIINKGKEIVVKTDYLKLPTTSAKIRKLTKDGYSRMEVSKILEIRYQHVRNVLITPIKRQAKKKNIMRELKYTPSLI